MKKNAVVTLSGVAAALLTSPASAHVSADHAISLAEGIAHPFSGLDHVAVMVAVGLWAALKGGRAMWLWPASFVALMVVGGMLGMAHAPLLYVEPAILASVVAIGLLVALAIDLPLWIGAMVVGAFAVFHGYAHGSEVAGNINSVSYLAGFVLATATLHAVGLFAGFTLAHSQGRVLVRAAGAACAVLGVALASGLV